MFRNILNTVLATSVLAFGCRVTLDSALAGTLPSAGQLVPPTFATRSNVPKTGFAFGTDLPSVAPSGAERSSLQIGDLAIEGLDPQFQAEWEALIRPLKGQKRTVSDIYKLAGDVQEALTAGGLFLNRVIIPPQHVVHGGTVKLKVVEGYIAEINLDALSPAIADRVARYFEPLKGKRALNVRDFERALMLAAGTSGLKLKTNMKPSKEALGITLTLHGDFDPLSAQISTDNALGRSQGTYQTNVSATINSPFHRGEQLYFVAGGAPFNGFLGEKSPRRTFAAGLTVPLWDDGLSANLEYTWSGTKDVLCGCFFQTSSNYRRLSAKLSYPFILSQTFSLTGRLGFDDVDEINSVPLFKWDLYHDHLNVLRTGLDYTTSLGGVQFSGGFDLSQGISGFGSRSAKDAIRATPISQFGASDRFTKLQADIHLVQPLPHGMTWDLSAKGQYSPTGVLMNSEKFVIGGSGDLSGVDSGNWSGDLGWSVRSELQFDMSDTFRDYGLTLKPYLFASRGQVYLANPTAVELPVDGATGFGVGIRGQWFASQYPSNPIEFGLEAAEICPIIPILTRINGASILCSKRDSEVKAGSAIADIPTRFASQVKFHVGFDR